LDDSELDIFDFEEEVSLPVRIYFALTNPWRKRWRRGLLWRIALVVMALASLTVLGYGSFWIWSELTKAEVNNLYRTISRY
jgi:fatty acid desaturase